MRLLPSLPLILACLGPPAAALAQPSKPLPAEAAPALGPKAGAAGGLAAGLPTAKPPPLPPGSDPFQGGGVPGGVAPARRPVSSGTGFVVAPGRLLTNWHVAQGCHELRARSARGVEVTATPVARDEERDLALLATPAEMGPPLTFRAGPEVRRGEAVVTF